MCLIFFFFFIYWNYGPFITQDRPRNCYFPRRSHAHHMDTEYSANAKGIRTRKRVKRGKQVLDHFVVWQNAAPWWGPCLLFAMGPLYCNVWCLSIGPIIWMYTNMLVHSDFAIQSDLTNAVSNAMYWTECSPSRSAFSASMGKPTRDYAAAIHNTVP